MYQNYCKKCGSISLHTEVKGNNTGLYCDDCGAWQKWIGKDELRAFEYSRRDDNIIEALAICSNDESSCDNCLLFGTERCANKEIKNAFALTKRLKAEIEALKNNKSEAIKEFAERVRMAFYYEFDELIPSIMSDKIDEIVKEMTEDKNG